MGDIEMIKGVLLAWLLCRQIRNFNEVDAHQVISGLGVYQREEGGTINTKHRCNTMHDMAICRARYALT